jgi:hypothetical protein
VCDPPCHGGGKQGTLAIRVVLFERLVGAEALPRKPRLGRAGEQGHELLNLLG